MYGAIMIEEQLQTAGHACVRESACPCQLNLHTDPGHATARTSYWLCSSAAAQALQVSCRLACCRNRSSSGAGWWGRGKRAPKMRPSKSGGSSRQSVLLMLAACRSLQTVVG